MLKNIGLILVAILITTITYFYVNNDYMTFKTYNATLTHKYQLSSYKRVNFIHVYKSGNISFDERVSATFYSNSVIGDKYKIKLRQFDIKQTSIQNILYFFLPIPCILLTALLWYYVIRHTYFYYRKVKV